MEDIFKLLNLNHDPSIMQIKGQKERVLAHIEKFGCITSMEAFKYGICYLQSVISNLKCTVKGKTVDFRWKKNPHSKQDYKEYFLVTKPIISNVVNGQLFDVRSLERVS